MSRRNLLVLGGWDPVSPRNRVLSLGLQQLGVVSRSIPLTAKAPHRLRTLAAVPRAFFDWADLVFLAKPAQPSAPFATWATHRAGGTLVADYFASLHMSEILDRRRASRMSPKAFRYYCMDRMLASGPDYFIADTATHRDVLAERYGLPAGRTTVVPVGAEPVLCDPLDSRPAADPLNVLFVGHYIPLHGVHVVLEAALKLQHSGILFTLVGSGPGRSRAEAFVTKHGLENVEMVDTVPYAELQGYLNASTVVLGIFSGGLKASCVVPKKVYLALASGRCVISGDTPAAREILKNHKTALLVPPEDPGALADALTALRDRRGLAARIGGAGYRLYQREFTPRAIGERFLNIPGWKHSLSRNVESAPRCSERIELSTGGEADRIAEVYAQRDRSASHRYSIFKRSVLLERQQVERALLRILHQEGWKNLEPCRILDLGTGGGSMLLQLQSLGARAENLVGIDLIQERLRKGKEAYSFLSLFRGDARRLPFADESFDISLQSTMLSSILEDTGRRKIAEEMRRVTRPGGCSIWYDMRITRPDNPEVSPIGPKEARAFFPDCEVESHPLSLNPILSRRIAPISWFLAEALSLFPFLCGHRITLIRFPIDSRVAA